MPRKTAKDSCFLHSKPPIDKSHSNIYFYFHLLTLFKKRLEDDKFKEIGAINYECKEVAKNCA